MRNTSFLACLAAVAVSLCAAARPGGAQEPQPPVDPQLSVEVRSADTGAVVGRLGAALGAPMEVEPRLANRRITIYASKANVSGLQAALASLYRTRWQTTDEGGVPLARLLHNAELDAQAEALRQRRLSLFLGGLLQTGDQLQRQDPRAVAAALRMGIARRQPELPQESLDQVTPAFISQALLLRPLRRGLGSMLLRSGNVWTPFRSVPASYQELLADFMEQQYPEVAGGPVDGAGAQQVAGSRSGIWGPMILNAPQARLEYRLLYGDRWAGMLMLTRVGAADNWATAILPSALYDLPDYATLYPEAQARPADPRLQQRVEVRIDTSTQTWDQALTAVARAAQINVVSDSFPRPAIFPPPVPGPTIAGTNLGETLDRLAAQYGYVWWRQGDFFVFRHRLWAEEQRVAVPELLLQAIANDLARSGRLSVDAMPALAGLTDEQVISLHLYGSAKGRPQAPPESFDYNEIQLIRSALVALAQVDARGLEQARGSGIPYLSLPPAAQSLFYSVGYDRGMELGPYEQDRWRLRLVEQFQPERLPTGAAVTGTLRFTFDFAQAGTRSVTLAVRVPALEAAPAAPAPVPAAPTPAAPMPAAP